MFISLCFLFDCGVVVGEVCSLCVMSVYSTDLLLYVFVWFICEIGRLFVYPISSALLIENAIVCSCQTSEGRTTERGRKEENMPDWSVFNISCGIQRKAYWLV